MFPSSPPVNIPHQEFLSWLWIDTHDEAIAREVVKRARAAGVPVRSGAPGYNLPTFFRAAVRSRKQRVTLLKALAPLSLAMPNKENASSPIEPGITVV